MGVEVSPVSAWTTPSYLSGDRTYRLRHWLSHGQIASVRADGRIAQHNAERKGV